MFIEQAYKGDNSFWKVLITSALTMGVFILNLIYFLMSSPEDMQAAYDLMDGVNKHVMLIANLGIFIPILILLFLLVRFLHQRSILSLTTSRPKVDFKRIIFAFSMVAIFTLVTFTISYFMAPEDYVLQFDAKNFTILFILSALLFPFQIGLEEYLFRGYLMQQIGIIAKNRWVPLIITSVLFGVFHSANPEVAEMGPIVMIFYIGTGLILGIMTLMDEGMELALGFHLGNNFLAATLVTAEYSALQTDAVFMSVAESATLSEIVAPVFIVYPIFLAILAYTYKWKNWKKKLLGHIDPRPVVINKMTSGGKEILSVDKKEDSLFAE